MSRVGEKKSLNINTKINDRIMMKYCVGHSCSGRWGMVGGAWWEGHDICLDADATEEVIPCSIGGRRETG